MVEGSSTEFIPLEKSKSQLWKYFEFPAHTGKFLESGKKWQTAHCILCKQALSYKLNDHFDTFIMIIQLTQTSREFTDVIIMTILLIIVI